MPRCSQRVQCVQEGPVAEIAIPPDRNQPFALFQGRLPDGQTTKIVVVPQGKGYSVVWFVGERIEAIREVGGAILGGINRRTPP
jgi:hypothetical protein